MGAASRAWHLLRKEWLQRGRPCSPLSMPLSMPCLASTSEGGAVRRPPVPPEVSQLMQTSRRKRCLRAILASILQRFCAMQPCT